MIRAALTALTTVLTIAAGSASSQIQAGAQGSDPDGTPAPVVTDPVAEAAEREQRINDRTERARREAWFNQLDRDGDGYLTEGELKAKQDLAAEPAGLDQDDDGLISRSEFAALELSADGSADAESRGEPGGNQ